MADHTSEHGRSLFLFFFLSASYDLNGRNRGSVPLKTKSCGSKRRTNRGLPHPQVENVSDRKMRKTEEGWMQEGKKSVRTEDRDPAGYRPKNLLILISFSQSVLRLKWLLIVFVPLVCRITLVDQVEHFPNPLD